MKTAMDVVKGKIVDITSDGKVLIEAYYTDWFTLLKRGYKECNVQMIDSRKLSDKQRKACYALIREISEFTGMGTDPTKRYMKIKFLAESYGETADKIFSLSNAPMSLVCEFQKYLIRFMIDWEIPSRVPLVNLVDDISDYIYACAVKKKCCVCGKDAEAHHHTRIGIGGSRKKLDHTGMPMEPLCRKHHMECHSMSQVDFDNKYHIEPVKIDAALIKVWKLNNHQKKYPFNEEFMRDDTNIINDN